MFARETLEYAGKIKKYSANLFPLAKYAYDTPAESDLKRRAIAICKKHVKELQKYTKKLQHLMLYFRYQYYATYHYINVLQRSILRKPFYGRNIMKEIW
jgi:hypothetical protein